MLADTILDFRHFQMRNENEKLTFESGGVSSGKMRGTTVNSGYLRQWERARCTRGVVIYGVSAQ